MQEFYKILGVSENATDEEIEAAYSRLKDEYSRDRFLEGEAGNLAAKNLTKLETAYQEIKESRRNTAKPDGKEPESLEEVEKLLKAGKIAEAQTALDNVTDRSAEWHYLQSVVFYKKNWLNESKKQLEIAMNIEPHNQKYSDAYTKLKQKMEFNERQFTSGNTAYGAGGANGYRDDKQMGGSAANDCLSFCGTWCCVNLVCNMGCR